MRPEQEVREMLEKARERLKEAEEEMFIIEADYYSAVVETLEWVLEERERLEI